MGFIKNREATKSSTMPVPKEIQNLAATWKQTGQENIDKQLEAAGLGWAKRKIAVNLSTTVTFSFPDDDTFHVDFVTKVMSKKEKFSISKVTKHKSKEFEKTRFYKNIRLPRRRCRVRAVHRRWPFSHGDKRRFSW